MTLGSMRWLFWSMWTLAALLLFYGLVIGPHWFSAFGVPPFAVAAWVAIFAPRQPR